ncbi:RDD family protein [Treponema sp. OttesenSCG-928-L16]|nr:RDD family protein [Treponema sp. OttesenSCG-928-L16]
MNPPRKENQDTSIDVQTPEGIAFVLYPAGLLIRACAHGIDTMVQFAVAIAANVIFGTLSFYAGTWLLMIILFGVNWFYHVFCELAFKGQSLGKRIMGLRVVMSDGSPVSPSASVLRNFLRFADTFMSLNLIALLCMSISPAFRRLGDWAGDTVVVYTTYALSPTRRSKMSWISRFDYTQPSRPLSYEEKQAILMFARRYPLLGRERANEIAGSYAESLRGEGEAQTGSEFLLGIARRLGGDEI